MTSWIIYMSVSPFFSNIFVGFLVLMYLPV